MKKTKKRPQSLGKTWSQDQQIMFELALYTIIDTYSPLIREYYDIDGIDEEIAKKRGLPDKYFTTRVDYAKYGR